MSQLIVRALVYRDKVIVAKVGIPGPPGTGSGSDANYRHTQIIPATLWTVTHNLGKYCSIHVQDNAGAEMFPSRQNETLNSFELNFGTYVIGGTCDCN